MGFLVVQTVNFVSKPTIKHMIYGLNRYEIKKTREQPGFSPFLGQYCPISGLIVALERQQIFPKKRQNKKIQFAVLGLSTGIGLVKASKT